MLKLGQAGLPRFVADSTLEGDGFELPYVNVAMAVAITRFRAAKSIG
jgi:hypothetical protein